MKYLIYIRVLLLLTLIPATMDMQAQPSAGEEILPGATQIDQYMRLIQDKAVAIFANQTSTVGNEHLIDFLIGKGVRIKKIFAPEHGFRGTAGAGDKIANTRDPETGIRIVSLYGKKSKPSADDLNDIDVLLFDIQDVGVRFYTYISSLQYFMEAAIENKKPLIILDRPNPNGFYVDGPVLDRNFSSFIGMQPVPVVYGMTIGEYAQMLLGERWLDSAATAGQDEADIRVVTCAHYTHKSHYTLPVKPSPNLPDMTAVYLYPSTCFFEGTVLSEGRGTDKPFQLFGHPLLPKNLTRFTPRRREGALNPKLLNQLCYGWDLSGTPASALKKINGRIQLKWLLEAYRLFPDKSKFFLSNNFFNLLAGNNVLMQQIRDGEPEAAIRASWQSELKRFKEIRKKYLLYPDF